MSARTTLFGALSLTVAGSALVLSASAAHAATDPDDTTFTPVATDIIGAGSDTSQHALLLLANAYNGTSPAPTHKLATFAATGGGNITLPSGAIGRPNGSGAGLNLLHGGTNNTDVDYARSSSAISTLEAGDGLQMFPFALDTLKMAVSNNTPSHAPASLSAAQIVAIYKGDITNWAAVGGTDGTIAPKIPQSGSGTRKFFEAQLKAANGGVAVVLAGSVKEVQEHDDATIKNDADAVAPFSAGRAALLGTTLRLENGFSADRALYNVVRNADVGNDDIQALFGEDGFVCSDAARELIETAGFEQLARGEEDGVCGQVTQSATTDFTVNQAPVPVATTTTLTAASTGARAVRLTARVTGSETPTGSVTFSEATSGSALGTASLIGGVATLDLVGVAPGSYTFSASYTPTEFTGFQASDDDSNAVQVKTSSSIKETFPATVKKGAKATGVVSVTLGGTATKATGKVTVKKGSKVVGTGTLKSGKATLKLAALPKGRLALKITWAGDANGTGSTKTFTITQK